MTAAPDLHLLDLLAKIRSRHEARVAEIGLDCGALHDRCRAAVLDHGSDVEAVVPPKAMRRLLEWRDEQQDYLWTLRSLTGRVDPPIPDGPRAGTPCLLGVPVVMEVTGSGDVEFRPRKATTR